MIRSEQTHLPVVASTHPGMTGKNNEDRYAVNAFRLRSARGTPALLAILSDGIGGHRAGEVAAEIAVSSIAQAVAASQGGDPTAVLLEAIQAASQAIYQHAQADPSRHGMGATCACAWIIGRRLYTATVGDSRIYLLRAGAVRQLSTDHTWVQEALDRGVLQPEQVHGHPNAHVIRRYLGSPTPPKPDFRLRVEGGESDTQAESNQGLQLRSGDKLLLCSDGLTDMVEDGEILAAFQTYPLDTAVQSLQDLANERGGLDNITMIAIEIPSVAGRATAPLRQRAWSWGCLGAVLAALLLSVAVIAGLWYFRGVWREPTTVPTAAATTQYTATAQPAPSQTIPAPEIIRTVLPSATPTRPFLFDSGPTLTPWPTNIPRP